MRSRISQCRLYTRDLASWCRRRASLWGLPRAHYLEIKSPDAPRANAASVWLWSLLYYQCPSLWAPTLDWAPSRTFKSWRSPSATTRSWLGLSCSGPIPASILRTLSEGGSYRPSRNRWTNRRTTQILSSVCRDSCTLAASLRNYLLLFSDSSRVKLPCALYLCLMPPSCLWKSMAIVATLKVSLFAKSKGRWKPALPCTSDWHLFVSGVAGILSPMQSAVRKAHDWSENRL